MKPLWSSLDDIQNRLVSLDTPAEVADALAEQAASIRQKMGSLAVTPAAAALLCFPSAVKKPADTGSPPPGIPIQTEPAWRLPCRLCLHDLWLRTAGRRVYRYIVAGSAIRSAYSGCRSIQAAA